MLIKRIAGATRALGAPADWDGQDMTCDVLPVLDVQTAEGNFMFSAWEPTPPELEALNKGANIILGVRGTVHPVVSVQVAADITQTEKHPDDIAVDQFADAMKAKLADARAKGRSGWQDCDPAELSYMLREHVEKGDPRDVANFCMFLWSLGQPIGDPVLPISGNALPKAESPAVAQPVADERAAFEHNLRVGYQNHNLKLQERGLASSDQLTEEQEREIAEHVELAFPSHTQGTSKSVHMYSKDTPIAFSCAKRAAHPTSWSMTCDKHCGDDSKCLRAASSEITSPSPAVAQPVEVAPNVAQGGAQIC